MVSSALKIGAVLSVVSSVFGASLDDYLNMNVNDNSDEHGLEQEGAKLTNCSCGWTNKARIVGGKEALPNEFPLIAGLMAKGKSEIYCGGTIITEYHVLTAAHCTYPLRMMRGIQLVIIVGEHDQKSQADTERQELKVLKTIEHERYHPRKYFNDISMVVLKEKIKFTQNVGPACLPAKPLNLLNEQVKVMGWGSLGVGKGASNVLMKLNLRVIPLNMCKENFKREIHLENPTQLCTIRKSKDSCEGDSGGPLIWLDPETNRYTLVALVSYGKTMCATGPAVNTDLSAYLDWVQKKVADTVPDSQTCSKMD